MNPTTPLLRLLRTLNAHGKLDADDERAVLALPYQLKTVEPQAYVVREGDQPTCCAVLVSGFAYRQKVTGDGGRQILALHIPGDALDFQNLYLEESDHSVQTLTRADVAFIDRDDLRKLASARPSIGRAMFLVTLVEASIFREWILNLGRRNAMSRVAHVLCEMAVRLDARGLAERYGHSLPMTQEQLADVTGLTPVHVNRTLKALENGGLIERRQRRMTFPDWPGLADVADFNRRYLHLAPERVPERA